MSDAAVFVVSKILTPLFNPLCIILVIWLVLIFRLRGLLIAAGRKKLLVSLFALWALGTFSGSALAAEFLVSAWEEPLTVPSSVDLSAYDAVVVLGGSADPLTSIPGNPSLNDNAERLTMAASLARQLPLIVFSGGSGDLYHQDLKEADVALDLFDSLGVPSSKVLIENRSRNTFENAKYTKEILNAHGVRKVLLLTSAIHMRRSAAIFEKAGLVLKTAAGPVPENAPPGSILFTPYVVDSMSQGTDFPESIIPDARNMVRCFSAMREMTGYIAYKVLGYL